VSPTATIPFAAKPHRPRPGSGRPERRVPAGELLLGLPGAVLDPPTGRFVKMRSDLSGVRRSRSSENKPWCYTTDKGEGTCPSP